jgi:tetratricopeptide (TPR) repeat protein
MNHRPLTEKKNYALVLLGVGWWLSGLIVTHAALASELVTEPLTEKEMRIEAKKTPTAVVKTPTPEYYGQKLTQRKYGEKKKNTYESQPARNPSDMDEFLTEPIVDSEKYSRPPATPTPRPKQDPSLMKVFSYVPKPGEPNPRNAAHDTEGPVPVKGVDLETEPLLGPSTTAEHRTDSLLVHADLDRNRVHLDESFTLTVDITGVDLSALKLSAPGIAGLDLISTNQAETRVTQQGRMLKLRTYHFGYLPLKTGTMTIPAVEIPFRGKVYATQSMSVEVEGPRSGFAFQRQFSGKRALMPKMMSAAPDDNTAPRRENEAEFYSQINRTAVYVNQQVNVSVHFRYQTELGTKINYTPPALVGFISEELPQTQGESLVSGTRQRTLERTYRTALFPIHAGSLNIGSASVVISQGNKDKTQMADSLALEVKPLPPDPEVRGEEGNTGLVGKYQMDAVVETARIEAEAPVRMRFILQGAGNLRGAPEPQLPDDPNLQWQLEEQRHASRVENEVVKGEHIFQYLMVPRKSGKINLPPARIRYFDPEVQKWKTAEATIPSLFVKPKKQQIMVAAPVLEAQTAAKLTVKSLTLRPNHAGNRVLLIRHKPPVENQGFWMLHGLGLLLLGAVWVWTHRRRQTDEDVLAARARRAHSELLRALKQAQLHIHRREAEPFYNSISRATAEYLAAKFGVTTSTIVIERLPELFERYRVPEEFQSQFKISLTVCEYVRFAAMEFPVQDMRALHKDLAKTVEGFEKFWRRQQAHRRKNAASAVMLLLGMGLLGPLTAYAGESELYFLRGNTYAQQEKYEAALAEYQKVISLGVHDPDVYFNLGNMYVQLGQTGRAVLAYERGLQLAPRDPDLRFNLKQAAGCVAGDLSMDDGWTGNAWGWRWYQSFTVGELAWTASACYSAALMLFLAAFFLLGARSILRWAAWLVLGCAVISAVWCGVRYTEPQWRKRAVVLAGTAEVRGRPYANAESLFTLTEGTRVQCEREEDEWIEVQLSNNRHGWVARSSLVKID